MPSWATPRQMPSTKRLSASRVSNKAIREDRDFHTIQTIEAAFRQYGLLRGADAATPVSPEAVNVLVGATRYLAAHSPTVRAQGQTYQIALRLHRGDHLYEDG